MKLLILLFAISRLSESSLPYHGVTVGFTPYSAPVNSHTQYQAQDVHGNYAYGYASALSAKEETKTADGVTRGGYSYIDANGILQTVQYVSDPVHGFRVVATNLPRDLPEVEHARAQHLAQFEYIKAEHALIAANRAHGQYPAIISPVPEAGAIVVPVQAAQVTPPIPVIAISNQYHAQDNIGQYSYGYSDPLSAKSETKTADGVTRGGYSYIDANGILQTVQYISDPINGFRVAATNLPEAPAVTLIGPKVTTTVVGPKDNNDVVVAQPAHVDPIAVDQNQPYLVPNLNPPPVVANPELPPPFYVPSSGVNSASPIPVPVPSYPSQVLLPPENNIPIVQVLNPNALGYGTNYHIPTGIESHSINTNYNPAINQQILNHERSSIAEGDGRAALFVPDAVQQVQRHEAPVASSEQVPLAQEQQAFIVRVAEPAPDRVQTNSNEGLQSHVPSVAPYYTLQTHY